VATKSPKKIINDLMAIRSLSGEKKERKKKTFVALAI
jgi:hypothetical protein